MTEQSKKQVAKAIGSLKGKYQMPQEDKRLIADAKERSLKKHLVGLKETRRS